MSNCEFYIAHEAWGNGGRNKCKIPINDDELFCEKHANKICSCGKQAIGYCDSSVSLACGAPTCRHDEHGYQCHYHADDGLKNKVSKNG